MNSSHTQNPTVACIHSLRITSKFFSMTDKILHDTVPTFTLSFHTILLTLCSLSLLISQADLLAVSWKHQASCHHRPFAPASLSAWDTCSQELSYGLLPHFIWYSTSVNVLKENFPAMYSSFPIFLKFYTLPNFFLDNIYLFHKLYIAYFLLSLLEYRHFGRRNLIHLAHYYIPNTHNNTKHMGRYSILLKERMN